MTTREPDWKEFAEQFAAHDSRPFDGALIETVCPGCGRTVGALVIDGPDPVFADVQCPHKECAAEWTERTR